MYFIVDGRVDLHWGAVPPPGPAASQQARATSNPAAEVEVAGGSWRERGPGDAFGELALFPKMAGQSRVATAVAREWGLMHMLPVGEIYQQEEGLQRQRVEEWMAL